ncbi:hypothetical protein M0813_30163 [Anaeramoeba flamelloides]|uniref:Uncharacterized protein n=1 Tax=Anaeramoeba flamelloides TaxID=1746091 RepID=A0ABQ8XMH4_9EUKA|nr:hypothetical protein M0813_30163 [Anaeramoeba flamelloides]
MTVHQAKLPTNKLLDISSSANPKINIQIKLLFAEGIFKTSNEESFLSQVKKEVKKYSKEFQQDFLTFQIKAHPIKLQKDYKDIDDPKKMTKLIQESLSFQKENGKEKEKEKNKKMPKKKKKKKKTIGGFSNQNIP